MAMFVILVSMSKVQDEKFYQVLESVHEYFGYAPGSANEPGLSTSGSLYEKLRWVAIEAGGPIPEGAPVNSVLGDNLLCQTIDEGYKITIGGKVLFDEGMAELKPDSFAPLNKLAWIIQGHPNKLEIKGHTATEPLPDGSPYKAVADYVCDEQKTDLKISRNRIRIYSGGPFDRPESNLTYEGQADNRRVEVIVSDELVSPEGAGGN
jgi:chemotaxis protein MotB